MDSELQKQRDRLERWRKQRSKRPLSKKKPKKIQSIQPPPSHEAPQGQQIGLSIHLERGVVLLLFNSPTQVAGLPPSVCRNFGAALIEHAERLENMLKERAAAAYAQAECAPIAAPVETPCAESDTPI